MWQRSRTERILHHTLRRFVAAANGIRVSVIGNIGETGAVIQCNFNGIAPRRSNVLKWVLSVPAPRRGVQEGSTGGMGLCDNRAFRKRGETMKRHVSVAIWLGSLTIAVSAQTPQSKPQAGPLVDSSRLLVQIEQTAPTGTTRVYGDPAQPGMFVSRVALRANTKNRPHYNDQDQIVTVLKGTWWVGKGEVFRQDKLVAVREGGLMYLPAKLTYYDVAGSGDVILQITGVGPVHSTHAELDAAGKPVAVGGPYPEDMQEGGGRRRRYALAVQDVNNVDPDNPDPPRGTQTQDPK
jgi:quercetin dioxygenase-like cupin family protein